MKRSHQDVRKVTTRSASRDVKPTGPLGDQASRKVQASRTSRRYSAPRSSFKQPETNLSPPNSITRIRGKPVVSSSVVATEKTEQPTTPKELPSGSESAFLLKSSSVYTSQVSNRCKICGYGFEKPGLLKSHLREHGNERPFPCFVCGVRFTTKWNLMKHQKCRSHRVAQARTVSPNGGDRLTGMKSPKIVPLKKRKMDWSAANQLLCRLTSINGSSPPDDQLTLTNTVRLTVLSSTSPIATQLKAGKLKDSDSDLKLPSFVTGTLVLNLPNDAQPVQLSVSVRYQDVKKYLMNTRFPAVHADLKNSPAPQSIRSTVEEKPSISPIEKKEDPLSISTSNDTPSNLNDMKPSASLTEESPKVSKSIDYLTPSSALGSSPLPSDQDLAKKRSQEELQAARTILSFAHGDDLSFPDDTPRNCDTGDRWDTLSEPSDLPTRTLKGSDNPSLDRSNPSMASDDRRESTDSLDAYGPPSLLDSTVDEYISPDSASGSHSTVNGQRPKNLDMGDSIPEDDSRPPELVRNVPVGSLMGETPCNALQSPLVSTVNNGLSLMLSARPETTQQNTIGQSNDVSNLTNCRSFGGPIRPPPKKRLSVLYQQATMLSLASSMPDPVITPVPSSRSQDHHQPQPQQLLSLNSSALSTPPPTGVVTAILPSSTATNTIAIISSSTTTNVLTGISVATSQTKTISTQFNSYSNPLESNHPANVYSPIQFCFRPPPTAPVLQSLNKLPLDRSVQDLGAARIQPTPTPLNNFTLVVPSDGMNGSSGVNLNPISTPQGVFILPQLMVVPRIMSPCIPVASNTGLVTSCLLVQPDSATRNSSATATVTNSLITPIPAALPNPPTAPNLKSIVSATRVLAPSSQPRQEQSSAVVETATSLSNPIVEVFDTGRRITPSTTPTQTTTSALGTVSYPLLPIARCQNKLTTQSPAVITCPVTTTVASIVVSGSSPTSLPNRSSLVESCIPSVTATSPSNTCRAHSIPRPVSKPNSTTTAKSLEVTSPRLVSILPADKRNNRTSRVERFAIAKTANRGVQRNEARPNVLFSSKLIASLKKYRCYECGLTCHKPCLLRKHYRTHSNVRPYVCQHCDVSFKTRGNLSKHMKSRYHHDRCVRELGFVQAPLVVDDATQVDRQALERQRLIVFKKDVGTKKEVRKLRFRAIKANTVATVRNNIEVAVTESILPTLTKLQKLTTHPASNSDEQKSAPGAGANGVISSSPAHAYHTSQPLDSFSRIPAPNVNAVHLLQDLPLNLSVRPTQPIQLIRYSVDSNGSLDPCSSESSFQEKGTSGSGLKESTDRTSAAEAIVRTAVAAAINTARTLNTDKPTPKHSPHGAVDSQISSSTSDESVCPKNPISSPILDKNMSSNPGPNSPILGSNTKVARLCTIGGSRKDGPPKLCEDMSPPTSVNPPQNVDLDTNDSPPPSNKPSSNRSTLLEENSLKPISDRIATREEMKTARITDPTIKRGTVPASSRRASGGIKRLANLGDPRPYKCSVCHVGFRVTGHLHKHYRAKSHLIAVLQSHNLPVDTIECVRHSRFSASQIVNPENGQLRLRAPERIMALKEQVLAVASTKTG
ncbi:unnamed protein product [Calicophoron daubneyi]|uniref:C2H2-type domain-containing protein n=1 Tax=Calicophoron daubneyi TaxID=300641 RepID=A0AAV2TM76_CALDB